MGETAVPKARAERQEVFQNSAEAPRAQERLVVEHFVSLKHLGITQSRSPPAAMEKAMVQQWMWPEELQPMEGPCRSLGPELQTWRKAQNGSERLRNLSLVGTCAGAEQSQQMNHVVWSHTGAFLEELQPVGSQ